MTVLASFVVSSEDLPIGQLVLDRPGVTLEFDRIVPAEEGLMPYIWVFGDDFDSLERDLAASPLVNNVYLLDQFENRALYRVNWKRGEGMLIQGIVDSGGQF